jgi:hypothetical protein
MDGYTVDQIRSRGDESSVVRQIQITPFFMFHESREDPFLQRGFGRGGRGYGPGRQGVEKQCQP